jgi:uncharacterized protein YndB with AHSA1/START domain
MYRAFEHGVTLVRVVSAPVAQVYAAWTEPAVMAGWLATVVDADVRVGGRYRIENHEDDGTVNAFEGEYVVLDPGERVVQTFRHVATEPETFVDEFVEVTLRALGPARTELTLTNGWDGLGMSDEEAEQLEDGWGEWLDLLESALDDGNSGDATTNGR